MLNLDFTEEQDMLRDMVRGLLTQYASNEAVREAEDDPIGYSTELWTQLQELDLLGLLLPAQYGGSEMSMLEGVILYEELGRALAPTPHLVSCVVSAGAIVRAGSEEQKNQWLPSIAKGESIFTPAWLEPDNGFGPRGVQVRAEADGDGFVISGVKQHVYFGSSAERLVVLARTGDGDGDVDLFLVDPKADGVTLSQRMSISSDTQYRVDFDGVRVAAADRLGAAGSGWATWESVMDDAMILASALANGGTEYALDITVQYSKDREQFDKPLGAFQALSHYMADAKTALDGAKIISYEAAWAHSKGQSLASLAPMAKSFACASYRDTTAMAQQIFGGVGFTLEYEIQLYFRRAKQLQISWNDTRRCEELIAAAILDD
ncbi:MAG TPA: acyl-CoA dehydrogenase family protein [Microthrixaceae bacterium]|nr:acyl-CoA dehydrogenase family protein [Microthrixaceae bacterium]